MPHTIATPITAETIPTTRIRSLRAMRGLIHRAPHSIRESCEQDALDRESEAEG